MPTNLGNRNSTISMKKSAKISHSQISQLTQEQLDYDREINHRAYELWEAAGGLHGDDLRHWLEAERDVRARRESAK
jgi:hypothetical protein